MRSEHLNHADPKMAAALTDLQDRIRIHFPSVTFAVTQEDDPTGVYLTATVDLDDPDAVIDVIGERLLELEVDEGLPIYVVAVRTPARVAKLLAQRAQNHRHEPISPRSVPL